LTRDAGSWLLLGEVLTCAALTADDGPHADYCGTCTACLDACPTQAIEAPGLVNSNACISYWTIEHRGPIPDAWKAAIGSHVFGCDVCQEVCPWNAPLRSLPLPSLEGTPPSRPPTRAEILSMGKGAWRRRFGKTAVNRAARRGLQRNAAASAGATRDEASRPGLERTAGVEERGLSEAAGWALRQLGARL